MEKAIIDTGIWIGAHWKTDQYNAPSKEIMQAFAEGKIHHFYLTDFVLIETINFLLRKRNYETAKIALEAFNSERITVYHVDALLFKKTQAIFNQYKALSLTDASLIALAEELNIKTIFSFDTLFDRVKGIQRLESFSE
ncbi:MAG TPA: PIN domain-containing protein [Candidatus Nanoarchaeia archaeon]|nr:PIN domain-containing protein [Candidatus Nanoarchaeia archaeon]